VVTLPLRLGRGQNAREHHYARHRRVAAEKAAVTLALRAARLSPPPAPYVVTLTRISPGEGIDTDNLDGALKSVRDAVADFLGVDDSPKAPVRWIPAQDRGPWGVEIRIEREGKSE
jgi:hypothetical protein